MDYPSIGSYLDTLATEGAGLWRSVAPLCPTYDPTGEAIYSSGNFGVVFRTIDPTGALRAVKCFTRPATGRAEAYGRLARELPHESSYLVAHRYLPNELLVWHHNTLSPFDILLMEWIEGPTLHTALVHAAQHNDRSTLEQLSASFRSLARWLAQSGWAHGDLKPENIIATPSGGLKLVDYDAVFLPSMAGEPQREAGTPAWQHPLREQMDFSPAIDHYPIALIGATIDALSQVPELLGRFTPASGGLLFDPDRAAAGFDPAVDWLEQQGLCTPWLELLQSPTPTLPTLGHVLRSDTPRPSATPWVPFEHLGRWGFRRAGSDQQIAPIFDRILPFCEARAAVCINHRWSYIDPQGEPIGRFAFDDAWSFCQQLAVVRRGNRYGYINPSGKTAIPARYDRARNFSEGYAVVVSDGRYGLIDTQGRWVVRPEWEHLTNVHHKTTVGERSGEKIDIKVQ